MKKNNSGENISACLIVPHVEQGISLQYWLDVVLQNLVAKNIKVTVLMEFQYESEHPVQRLLQRFDVDVVNLYSEPKLIKVGLGMLGNFASHYRVHEFLKTVYFDDVICFDTKGLTFYSCVAKNLGIAFADTNFYIVSIKPLFLTLLTSNHLSDKAYLIGLGYMERRAAELSDRIITSHEIYEWMIQGGYNLKEKHVSIEGLKRNDKNGHVAGFSLENGKAELNILLNSVPEHFFKVIALSVSRYEDVFSQYSTVNIVSDNRSIMSKHFEQLISSRNTNLVINHIGSIDELTSLIKPSSLSIVFDNKFLNLAIISLLNDLGRSYRLHQCAQVNNIGANYFNNQRFNPRVFAELVAPEAKPDTPEIKTENNASIVGSDFLIKGNHLKNAKVNSTAFTDAPKVSLIVVHHERPDYLSRILLSIQAQDYKNIEVIVIDDGSLSKESLLGFSEVKRQYSNKKNWLFLNESNQWLGAARNTAATHATSDYLIFIDDDNILKPEFVSTYIHSMLHSNSDILTCFTYSFLENEFRDYENSIPPIRAIILPIGGCLALGMLENCYGDASCIVKKEVFDDLGGFWEFYGLPKEDHDFFSRAATNGYRVEVVPEALYYYRLSDTGMMSSNSNNSNFDYSASLISSLVSSESLAFNQSLSLYEKQAQKLISISLWVNKDRGSYNSAHKFLRLYKRLKALVRKLPIFQQH